ncbi:MAG: hypothetical protein ACO3JL_04200 [Myxococcota bacterium]
MSSSLVLFIGLLLASVAHGQRDATVAALERFEERLAPLVEEGALSDITPVLLASAQPAFEETRAWYPTAAAAVVVRLFGDGGVRLCEACMNPEVNAIGQRLELRAGPPSTAELLALDARVRGAGAPARAALFVDETPGGIAIKVVSLENGAVLYAANLDRNLSAQERSGVNHNYSLELDRRLRGDSLTHVLFDGAVYPNQHLSLDVLDQFGDRGQHLAGVTMTAIEPVIGVGASYQYVFQDVLNVSLGGKLAVSVPTAALNAITTAVGSEEPVQLLDPLLTGIFTVRVPIPSTNFAVFAMATTNLRFGVGLTLLNTTLLPVLP